MSAPKRIEKFGDFIAFITKHCDGKSMVYRGQSMDRDLVPKIARIHLHGDVVGSERKMFEDFKRKSVPFLSHERRTDLELLAIAQHHGMATRLLDWSENPFVALWFAVERPPKVGEESRLENGVFWVLDTRDLDFIDDSFMLDPLAMLKTYLYRPRHIASRIISQSGLFSLHHMEEQSGKHVPLNTHPKYKGRLRKLIIPNSSFRVFRKELDRFGFNAQKIFPDIEGVCRDVQWQHSYLEDEGEARLVALKRTLPKRFG